jgi:hypothetical protein
MNKKKRFPVMAIAAIITCVLVTVSCDSGGESLPDILEGTWTHSTGSYVFVRGTWTEYGNYGNNNIPEMKGTYTVSGNTATLNKTHDWTNNNWVVSTTPSTISITNITATTFNEVNANGTTTFTKQ